MMNPASSRIETDHEPLFIDAMTRSSPANAKNGAFNDGIMAQMGVFNTVESDKEDEVKKAFSAFKVADTNTTKHQKGNF